MIIYLKDVNPISDKWRANFDKISTKVYNSEAVYIIFMAVWIKILIKFIEFWLFFEQYFLHYSLENHLYPPITLNSILEHN
jgi:hypothetical protein